MGDNSTLWRYVSGAFSIMNLYSIVLRSIQAEICHVVRVLSVEIDASDDGLQTASLIGSIQGDAYELPTCPVCLERMDSAVTGLVTVPCSHTFHCACLSKWGDSRY